jgi:Methylamine utilisation protein MauE
MLDPAIGRLLVLCCATLFAGAAAHKLRDTGRFATAFESYGLLPAAVRPAAARMLPFGELAIAAGLMYAATRGGAAMAGGALLLIYASAIAVNLRRGRPDLVCGCGGPDDRRLIAAWMVWRNVALAGVLALLALPWRARPLLPADFLTIGGGVATAVLLYMSLDRLLGEVAPRAAALRAPPGRAAQ